MVRDVEDLVRNVEIGAGSVEMGRKGARGATVLGGAHIDEMSFAGPTPIE
jgi:hypothetical protein